MAKLREKLLTEMIALCNVINPYAAYLPETS